MDRVLTTPELLEAVLIHLDVTHLLAAQRVCSYWHTLITSSPVLKAALFLHPAPSSSTPRMNPLFASFFFPDQRCSADHPRVTLMIQDVQPLLDAVPAAWQTMMLFQPPTPFQLSLSSRGKAPLSCHVSFPNEPTEPVMAAVEKAAFIFRTEQEKRRNAKTIVGGFLGNLQARGRREPSGIHLDGAGGTSSESQTFYSVLYAPPAVHLSYDQLSNGSQ